VAPGCRTALVFASPAGTLGSALPIREPGLRRCPDLAAFGSKAAVVARCRGQGDNE